MDEYDHQCCVQYNYIVCACVCVFVVCDIESKQHKFHDNIIICFHAVTKYPAIKGIVCNHIVTYYNYIAFTIAKHVCYSEV